MPSEGLLSDAQLESVIYAGEAHACHLAGSWTVDATFDVVAAAPDSATNAVRFRRGWFLGDGTGCGKGRQVAGIILDNWLKGRRKALWISKSELIEDARRDWSALGQERLLIQPLARFRQGTPIRLAEGILFVTYATLRSAEREGKASRLDQILAWLGREPGSETGPTFDGVIVFDESHAMQNAAGGKTERGEEVPSQQGRGETPVAGTIRLGDDAPRASRDLGHPVCAEVLHDLVERPRHRVQRRQVLDQPVAPLHGLAALHGLPVPEHRARGQAAVAVGVLLEQLRRERVSEIRENGPTRSGVDHKVAPLLGGNIGEAPLHQRLAGGDELHHGRVAGLEVALDALDQRRRLHGRKQVVVEPLLRALECGPRRRLGLRVERARSAPAAGADDVRGLQRRGEVVVDHLEGTGVGVVDALLLRRQRVLDQLVLDALIGERPCRVEAEALEVAGQHLHGGHAAGLDRLHELSARGEGGACPGPRSGVRPTPQAQALGIGEVVHRRGAGR